MPTYTPPTLQQLNELGRHVGRAVPFYSTAAWDGAAPLALEWLGDTDGPFSFERNEEKTYLRAEVSGPAKLRTRFKGEDPTITIPELWWATEALKTILTATETASGGYTRQREPEYRTLVLFPEEFLYDPADKVYGAAAFTDGTWQVNGKDLTDDQERLLAFTLWCWKVVFSKPEYSFTDENAGEAKGQVTAELQHAYTNVQLPEGHLLYTVGDPYEYGIDLEGY
jgi:hypothetical protein